jgi:hypothetical protein
MEVPPLSKKFILDLTVLVPNNHRVTGIDYRNVQRAVALAFDEKLRLIL